MSQNGFLPGKHVLLDLYGAQHLTNLNRIKETLIEAAEIAGASVLNVDLHTFGEALGVTGVAVLAESHISIHTWPEHDYAAIDIFMCGTCDPELTIPTLITFFAPSHSELSVHYRGQSIPPTIKSNNIQNNQPHTSL